MLDRLDFAMLGRGPLVGLGARRELDRLPMRGAQVSALPLMLALVEFFAREAAFLREQPLKRREDGPEIGLAIVGLGASAP